MIEILQGHCLDLLGQMRDESVHCIVTSPPYWGLRDYGLKAVAWPTGWKGCHGLEPTVDLYVQHEVLIFREARRVLREDGTLWLNLGDTYSGGGLGGGGSFACDGIRMAQEPGTNKNVPGRLGARLVGNGIKTKELVGVPWRVAFALQADGWFLRCDNVWHKPNPMPESVRDRSTRCHEFVFHFSKSKRYFYDLEAVKEASSPNAHARSSSASQFPSESLRDRNRRRLPGVNPKALKLPGRNSRFHQDRDPNHSTARKVKQNESFSAAVVGLVSKRNMRSVWTVATAPYRGAHFATFPPKLIERCILAGTSERGCCAGCGASFARVVAKGKPDLAHQRACGGDLNGHYNGKATKDYAGARAQNASDVKARILAGMVESVTVGWKRGCNCGEEAGEKRCVVLDPFGGSGTVGEVCNRLGRDAILLELNGEYIKLANARCGL
ncbi:MAG TPA: site-specific DNA-methyltransferase [Verrucomicrobiae bacterium]|nr:site-specific DNA-methyltransferase [Verrucomicrobiae bacterium]